MSLQLVSDPNEQLIFSGPPTRLQGTLRLSNPTQDKLKLRSVAIQAGKLLGAARLPLNEIPLSARLAPGEQLSVQSTIGIDPQTPPGTYPIELTIGDRTIKATAKVSEVVDFKIEPNAVTILAGKDTEYTRDFVVENAGNVPLPLGERCEATLLDSADLVASMLVGLHNAPQKESKSQLESWLAEWGNIAAGTLVVKRDAITLSPGQKISASATFVLPADLKPLRHYRASLQLYNAIMAIDIYTTVKAGTKPSKAR